MAIHADKLRWLFWLRWKTLMRGYTRKPLSIIGALFVLLFIVSLAGTIAVVSFIAYRILPSPANSEVLYLVLTAVLLLWIMLPLLEFTANEGLDASKLILYPLTRAELMASLLFSTLLDIPTIGLVLVLVAVIAGWAVSLPVTILASVTMLIFYIQVVGISQLVLALFMRVLQGRRFRDLSIIIIALFTSSCYLIQQFVLGGTRILHLYDNLRSASFSPYLQWLPSGLAARSITQAIQGNWGASIATLALLLVTSVLTLYLWQFVLQRSLSASEVGASARARGRRRQQTPAVTTAVQPAGVSIWERLIPPQISALAVKELKYFWRDPQLKAMMFQSVIYVAIFLVAPLLNPNSTRFGGNGYVLLITPMIVILFMLTLSCSHAWNSGVSRAHLCWSIHNARLELCTACPHRRVGGYGSGPGLWKHHLSLLSAIHASNAKRFPSYWSNLPGRLFASGNVISDARSGRDFIDSCSISSRLALYLSSAMDLEYYHAPDAHLWFSLSPDRNATRSPTYA